MSEPRLSPDVWLTQHLGKPAFHLIGDVGRIDPRASPIVAQLAEPMFADVKVQTDDAAGVKIIRRLGFDLIDTNLSFIMPREAAPKPLSADVGFATPDMAYAVGEIAATSFSDDRFHRDSEIPKNVADNIKRSWATNFFAGKRGEWMVVACQDNKPVGFLQLLRGADSLLIIDLIAVLAAQRGRDLAKAMIAFACAKCECAGPIVVGTQVANTRSVRLYERLGFRFDAAQYVFHHHGTTC
jgi:ribosomal protein S18 acetylase RimI-like enzyme